MMRGGLVTGIRGPLQHSPEQGHGLHHAEEYAGTAAGRYPAGAILKVEDSADGRQIRRQQAA